MATIYKSVDVEIDLTDFGTNDLISELQDRGVPDIPGDLHEQRQAMLRALWDNDDAKTIDLLKTYLCDCLGRATI